MPAVPQGEPPPPPFQHAADPNQPSNYHLSGPGGAGAAGPSKSRPTHQPAPGVISSEPFEPPHVLHRRFLGPMPEHVAHSTESEEKRKRFKQMRKSAIQRLKGEDKEDEYLGMIKDDDARRRQMIMQFIRKHRRKRREERRRREGLEGGSDEGDLDTLDTMETDSDTMLSDDVDDHEEGSGGWGGKWKKGGKGKQKQRRRDVWIGESFDIGQEFKMDSQLASSRSTIRDDEAEGVDGEAHAAESTESSKVISALAAERGEDKDRQSIKAEGRPQPSRHTTQDTFVTARTEFSISSSPQPNEPGEDHDEEIVGLQSGYHLDPNSAADQPLRKQSVESLGNQSKQEDQTQKRQSGSSSMQPLMGSVSGSPPKKARDADTNGEPIHGDRQSQHSRTQSAFIEDLERDDQAGKEAGGSLRKRLKSAMRKTSKRDLKNLRTMSDMPSQTHHGSAEGLDGRTDTYHKLGNGNGLGPSSATHGANTQPDTGKSKSVQFPLDPVEYIKPPAKTPEKHKVRKGNKEPADPAKVLSRRGDAMEGTSAGAVEDAQQEAEAGEGEEEEEDDEVFLPGQIVMQDRMLVKIGYHRDDGLMSFNEASQRRNPCSRLEPFEEYLVAWRKGCVEFYQDTSNPLRTRFQGDTKKLCFIVPLLPNRTSLGIFNETDLTISLTTSAGRLQSDLEQSFRSYSTRSSTYKNRVQQSRQAKWLRTGRRGTHVFILKLGARSRALDWFWEIWRELGGELPPRFEVSIPTFSSSVRIAIPENEDADMVGSKKVCSQLSPGNTVKTVEGLVKSAIDLEWIYRQRKQAGLKANPELALTWKSAEGLLDWISDKTTTSGQKRDWAVLAGVALMSVEMLPGQLQLREAKHQPQILRLEDGSVLEEPAGIEGYLKRYKGTSATSASEVYVTTHDGHIVVSKMGYANPPTKPGKEGSTPINLFGDVYKEFRFAEHRRLASIISQSNGCIDFRAIKAVNLLGGSPPADPAEGSPPDSTQRAADSPGRSTSATGAMGTSQVRPGESQADGNGYAPSPAIPAIPAVPAVQGKGHDDRLQRCFEVQIDRGGNIMLEARSPEVAREWVERLETLIEYWKRRQRADARIRMDAVKLNAKNNPFSGTHIHNQGDNLLDDIWNWCVLEGCRSVTLSGKLYMKKGRLEKFRARYIMLTGGSLVPFKMKTKYAYHLRKRPFPLFGAYVYSGMLAQEELHEENRETLSGGQPRVYQDGLESSDSAEDTTFCIRLMRSAKSWSKRTNPWTVEPQAEEKALKAFRVPGLSTAPRGILIFRARSKLERDRWVWAINAEIERQTREHVEWEKILRDHGSIS